MYKFILMRHGRSFADDELRHEGRHDSDLTTVGIDQAIKSANLLQDNDYNIERIISSPLKRATKTAEIIGNYLSIKVIINELLVEQDNGILAGKPKAEALRQYPMPAFISPFRYYPEHSGENEIMLHARAGLALNSLLDNQPGQYLIISHGGIINAILRNMLGIKVLSNDSGTCFRLKDNGFIEIDYYEDKDKWIMIKLHEGFNYN